MAKANLTALPIPSPLTRHRPFWPAALTLGVLLVAAYSNSFRAPFIFDDRDSILLNPSLRHWGTVLFPPGESGLTVSGRPVLNLTFALNYALSGKSLVGYHLTNLLIHFSGALVLFGLVRRTLTLPRFGVGNEASEWWTALTISFLWALHPLQTESVTYTVQRAESLVGLFYLLTLYLFVRSVENPEHRGWRTAAWVACLLGMGSKEVMASAPVVVFLYDRTFVSGSFREAWRQRKGFHLALAATWALLATCIISTGNRGGTVGFGGPMSAWSYALTQNEAIIHYLRLVFWPNPLVMDYGRHLVGGLAEVWLQIIVVFALVVATVWACARRPALGFLGAVFFAVLAPTSSVIPVITQTMAEHRMYLALAPVIAGVVVVVQGRWGQRAIMLLLGVAGAFAGMTFVRNQDYRSVVSIWSDTAEKRPDNFRAWFALGYGLSGEEKYEEAKAKFERALELQPGDAEALIGLGSMLYKTGKTEQSLEILRIALQGLSDTFLAAYAGYHNYGLALVGAGRVDEGIVALRKAISLKPEMAEAHYGLGNALVSKNQLVEAVAEFKAALALDPDQIMARANLGDALIKLGRCQEAIEVMSPGLPTEPKSAELRYNIGLAHMNLGHAAEAAVQFEEAVRVNPRLIQAHVNLGILNALRGDMRAACLHYKTAIKLGERNPVLFAAYGRALLKTGRMNEAIEQLTAAVSLAPADWQVRYFLAAALLQDGRWREAAQHYEQVLAQSPNLAEAHNDLGIAYQRLGRLREARAEFESALRLRSDYTEARQNLEGVPSP